MATLPSLHVASVVWKPEATPSVPHTNAKTDALQLLLFLLLTISSKTSRDCFSATFAVDLVNAS